MTAEDRYGVLIQKILEHPRYGPAMQEAVGRGAVLVLNYHCHQGNERHCVSIAEKQEGAIELLDLGLGNLRELVHIEGFGRGAEDCVPLCGDLAQALSRHYGLTRGPLIYLEGEPVGAAEASSGGTLNGSSGSGGSSDSAGDRP